MSGQETMRSAARSERDVLRSGRASAAKWSPFDFVGRMTAVVAILPIERAAAEAMLPAGLALAAQDHIAGDRHPLVLILGHQSNVRPKALPFGADYLEFILAVPFVEHEGSPPQGPFCYCPRLFLDRFLPTLLGRLLYGYAKQRAAIEMTESSYRIADPGSGDLLLSADSRPAAAAVEAPLTGAARYFELAVISEAARGWWYSFADFGLDRAVVQPVELALTIHRTFVPGLPLGEFRIAATEAGGARAFRIRTSWRLAGPFARRSPAPTWVAQEAQRSEAQARPATAAAASRSNNRARH